MKRNGLSRREWLGSMAALSAPLAWGTGGEKRAPEEYALRNDKLDFRLTLAPGAVTSRCLTNKLANETVQLPAADFRLEFAGGTVVDPSQFTARATRGEGKIELLYAGAQEATRDLEVRVEYTLPPGQHYLRKQVSVRQSAPGQTRRLMRADLDIWKGVRRDWQSAIGDHMPYGSHPIHCPTLWAGVEFPAAFNEYGREGFILRSRPGGKLLSTGWLPLHSTVAGVAAGEGVRDSFLRYIDDVRLAPPRLVACYNTWWSLPEIFDEKKCLALVQTLVQRIYQAHGVFFDYVTADMGWSHPQSIWEVNQRDFPNGLAAVNAAVNSAQGKLGLWMSPSEVYAPVMDYAWAEKNGYVPVKTDAPGDFKLQGLSLAEPTFRAAVKAQLQRLIKEYGLGQIKFDGFIARETSAHHGLLPNADSVEPLAEYTLELLAAARGANPALFTEPTYMNSLVNYISPWIMKYSTSVWGNAGGDCPVGIGPAPDYRESQTTAREYFIFTSLDEVWLPQNALHYFDIIHCDEAGGFANHAAMAFGRGRLYVSTYIDPKFVNDADWKLYAGLLKWARGNQATLKNTVVLPSRVELGEPYAYAHWDGQRGIVAVRNPSNASQTYTLDLATAGAPEDLAEGVCYVQYPYRQGIRDGVTGRSTVTLDLAPWELVFLEIVPRAALSEPVALGARWERDAGRMKVAAEGSGRVRVLLARDGEQAVDATPLAAADPKGEILARKTERLPEAEWLRQGDKALPTASFELDAEITVPRNAQGKALLLLEFPGKDHLPSTCTCLVDGRPAELKESTSAGHIGYDMVGPETPWRDLIPFASQWTWYTCELEGGLRRVVFRGACPQEKCKPGLWVWADWDLREQAVPVAVECPEPAMPQLNAHRMRRGICVLPPEVPSEPPPSRRSWSA
jgi:hypothetical protein